MKKLDYQKSNQPMWKDEKGIEIPYSRTTKSERLQEQQSYKIAKEAIKLNTDLSAFKNRIKAICIEVYDTFMTENDNTTPGKGNFTWKNFDGSIKIECSVSERIEFDDLTITACKDKLNEFLDENVESKEDFVKQMVVDAFETSKGKLDAKKVMSLLRYRSKIKASKFQEALNLLESAIRRPESKTYFRVWIKDEEGKYQSIELNFSAI